MRSIQIHPLLRIAGQSPSIADIVHQAASRGIEQTQFDPVDGLADATLIDPTLHTEAGSAPPPAPGVGYAGLSPRQRHQFLLWAAVDTSRPAPAAFQQLYCAHLEIGLLAEILQESTAAQPVQAELAQLVHAPGWQDSPALARVLLLACRLNPDGWALAKLLDNGLIPSAHIGIALGLAAMLGQPLSAQAIAQLRDPWNLAPGQTELPTPEVLKLHLSSLETGLGAPILAHVLANLPDEQKMPKPWRANHRQLRVRFAQPDLRRPLLPLLRELYIAPTRAPRAFNGMRGAVAPQHELDPESAAGPEDESRLQDKGWQLILEFGNSRSEFFDVVLRTTQKQATYAQLMDENRQLVHRVTFKRSEIRRFWRIWDYVQSWSSTRVYLNGEELEKWKIWPYSQYLQ